MARQWSREPDCRRLYAPTTATFLWRYNRTKAPRRRAVRICLLVFASAFPKAATHFSSRWSSFLFRIGFSENRDPLFGPMI